MYKRDFLTVIRSSLTHSLGLRGPDHSREPALLLQSPIGERLFDLLQYISTRSRARRTTSLCHPPSSPKLFWQSLVQNLWLCTRAFGRRQEVRIGAIVDYCRHGRSRGDNGRSLAPAGVAFLMVLIAILLCATRVNGRYRETGKLRKDVGIACSVGIATT